MAALAILIEVNIYQLVSPTLQLLVSFNTARLSYETLVLHALLFAFAL